MYKLLILFFILCSFNKLSARALYVNDFDTILGNTQAEEDLLFFAQSHQIETLLLYDLHTVNSTYDLTNAASNTILSSFIKRAREDYDILHFGAIGENYTFFSDVIQVYNNSRSNSLEKFDIYNLEFEYWVDSQTASNGYYCTSYLSPNGYPCNEAGAFLYYIDVLDNLNNLISTSTNDIQLESYLGWPTESQVDTIVNYLDVVRLHAYLDDPNNAFNYTESRLSYFASAQQNFKISIIYSSENQFMNSWLNSNSMLAAENIYLTDYDINTQGWTNSVALEAFTYFTYTDIGSVILSIDDKDNFNPLSIYPNPFRDKLILESLNEFESLSIRSLDGSIVYKQDISTQKKLELSLAFLKEGVYLLHLRAETENKYFQLVKQ